MSRNLPLCSALPALLLPCPLFLSQGADVQVWYCDFAMNKGAQGAAVTLRDPGTSAEFSFSTFWQNSASGGWFSTWVGTMGCIAMGKFHKHEGLHCAIAFDSCCLGCPNTFGVHSSHPLTHPCAGNGGALFIQSGSAALTNCSFTRNDAMYGGAIAMESSAALYSGGGMDRRHSTLDVGCHCMLL